MRRRTALAIVALLALASPAGATKKPAEPAPTYAKKTRTAEVELRAPPALSAWPAFRDVLVSADTAKLNGFLKGPGASAAAGGRKGRNWRRIAYEPAGMTSRLASVVRRDDSYTGGAHPLPTVSGVIWDQRTKRRLSMGALFRPDADMPALDRTLCRAVKAAKAGREGAVPLDGDSWKCPLWSQASAALAPSTARGKAGGLVVLINPYEVGPYVEGEYRVLIPYAGFRRALRAGYATEFAGAPSAAATALLAPPVEAGAPKPPPKAKLKRAPEPEKTEAEPVAPAEAPDTATSNSQPDDAAPH